ncbi:MAG: ABC transporter permease [Bacteroidota bacterium]
MKSLKIFIRTVKKNKLFSIINALGLTVGFFASVLIYVYVQNELNYDQFHDIGDRIYRINQTFIWGEDNPNLFSSTGPAVGYAIKEEISEVREVVRVHTPDLMPIRFTESGQEKFFKDETLFAVDSNFLEVFTFPLLYGNKETALDDPNSVVLTKETSLQLFGSENPVGRLIDLGGGPLRKTYQITGVMEEVKGNSYIGDFDMLMSMSSIDRVAESNWNWMWTMFETYVVIDKGADLQVVQRKLDELPKKHAVRTLDIMGYTYDEYIAAGKEWNLYLQPFEDIYLKSDNIYNRLSTVGNYQMVKVLIGSAIFLVILSCINFINLSTAQFTSRAKDVALRKVLGGSKITFRMRFFGESLLFCLFSCVLALLLIFYTLPFINQAIEVDLSLSRVNFFNLLIFVTLLVVGVSAVSSFYPFTFFNSFKPVSAMKGEFKTGKKGVRLRNGMLVTQYVLSFLLIICTLTVYEQLSYFLSADVGFEKENLLVIENAHWVGSQEEFVNELTQIDGIINASICDSAPFLFVSNGDQFQPDRPDAGSIPLNFSLADENYLPMLGIELLVGRAFNTSFSDDVNGVIINETAARTIGWEIDESILNKKIENWSGSYHIIGVSKDFNFWSLRAPIEPYAIFHASSNANNKRPLTRILIKSQTNDKAFADLTQKIAGVWKSFIPNRPFDHFVLDQEYQLAYQTEKRFGRMISFFAILTVIIASLGLLGIVVFSFEQKLKEVGVRKVLGASVMSIVMLFSKSYIKLIMLGFLLAVPIGYYFMESWLSDYEYRIHLSPGIFLIALVILLVISMAISTFYSLKASLLNPAEILKDE